MKKKPLVLLGVLVALQSDLALSSCAFGHYDVTFFNWGEYILDDIVENFEADTGYRVKIQTFQDNEGMLTKLDTSSYDIVCPSDYAIEELYQEGRIRKLDFSRFQYYSKDRLIPALRENLEAMDKPVHNEQGDEILHRFPFLDYAVPYTWGEVGIIYDKNTVTEEEMEEKGWDILHDSTKKIAIYDSSRDVYSIALAALGYNFTTPTPAQLDEADQWLRQLPKDTRFLTDQLLEDMPAHHFDLALDYSGDAFYSIMNDLHPDEDGNSTLGFYIPKAREGSETRTNIFSDSLVIMNNCTNTEAAYAFIDYLSKMDAENRNYVAAENLAEIAYVTPFSDAMEVLTWDKEEDNPDFPRYTYDRDADPTGAFADIKDDYDLGKVASDKDHFYRYDDKLKAEMENRYENLKASLS